jgi:hypothetical protein
MLLIIDFYRKALWRNEERLNEMVRGVSATTGEAFFNLLTQNMCRTVGADYAFIGELIGPERDRVRTVAIYSDGQKVENFEFDLKQTPCEIVVNSGPQSFRSRVRELSPLGHPLCNLILTSSWATSDSSVDSTRLSVTPSFPTMITASR